MEIRKVQPTDDVQEISRIYALSWKTAYQGIIPQGYLDGLEEGRWAAALSADLWQSYVAVVDGNMVGTYAICPARDEQMPHWGELVSLYLLPEYLKKGYGKAMLKNAIAELTALKYKQIYLWVLEDNLRARNFYEQNGFIATNDAIQVNIDGKELQEMRYIYTI